jgi:aldehyde dehydrogenase (NAD+)
MPTFEYAPAPESRAVVDMELHLRPVHQRRLRRRPRHRVQDRQPGHRGGARRHRRGEPRRCRPRVKAARTAYTRVWSRMSGADRGKYLFRIARILQERAREFAVLETLDNGKPIKETRDVDMPLAAAHFFYHAGWADKLSYAGYGPDPRPLGVVGQIIPWNFPLLMLAWKIAPALACGNTVVLKPAETTPLTALLFAEVCQQAELPPGVVNIVTGAGDDRAGHRRPPRHRQDRLHRLDRVGKMIARSIAGTRKRPPSSSAARAPTSSSTTPPSTRPSRASSTGSSSTRATSAAPEADCSCRSRSPTRSSGGCKRGWRPCASATRSTRTPTSAPSTRRPARPDHRARRRRRGRGCGALGRRLRAAEKGFWFAPTVFTGRHARPTGSPRRRSSVRSCRCSPSAPRRGGGQGQQHALRPVGGSGPRRVLASCGWPTSCAPAWCGPTPSTSSTRPRRSAATRSPATAAKVAATASRPT